MMFPQIPGYDLKGKSRKQSKKSKNPLIGKNGDFVEQAGNLVLRTSGDFFFIFGLIKSAFIDKFLWDFCLSSFGKKNKRKCFSLDFLVILILFYFSRLLLLGKSLRKPKNIS